MGRQPLMEELPPDPGMEGISKAEGVRDKLEADNNSSSAEESAKKMETEGKAPKEHKRKLGRKNILTPQLEAALDLTKVSDRKAVYVIAETTKNIGYNIDEFSINRNSPPENRPKSSEIYRHKGEEQSAAVFEAIESWGISNNIHAMCFDTTSSNTGRNAGTCVLLEQKLEKVLLSLACRHHVMELIIGSGFVVCMGATSAPEVLFKRFKEYWRFIDTDQYETGISIDAVAELIKDIKEGTIVNYTKKYLEQSHSQLRGDYKEFVELVIIFFELPLSEL
ncbi:hypothetical protein AVEN_194418-1 [Araneus ventricosus]|uniref:Uncharacterized protein n=1 Tax=Araneus ventricosus TaxID=182803 RepID=A0A4Y2A6W6_ARAVE|nr:hypothetical protein AVEN_194418-1 [Araneus ventricosus]